MPGRPKLEERRASKIAYVELRGAYDSLPWAPTIEKLYGWAKKSRVMPGFHPMGIYPDDPKKVPASKRRSRIAITFKGAARGGDGVRIGTLPAMTVASVSHKGPSSAFRETYATLAQWTAEKGLKVAGAPIEIYSKKPITRGGQTIFFAKILFPVKRASRRHA